MTMDHNHELPIETPPKEQERTAGFWMRFWAYVIDVCIIFSINGFLISPIKLINDGMLIDLKFWTLGGILSGLIYYLYFALLTKQFQQTVGKMIIGLKVVPTKKEQLGWSDVFFREVVGRFIYNLFTVFKLLYIVVAFTKDNQGLHDLLGDTKVIHKHG